MFKSAFPVYFKYISIFDFDFDYNQKNISVDLELEYHLRTSPKVEMLY